VHAELAESSGAGVRVADAEQLAVAVVDALRDPDARRARVVAGQEALAVHRGTARRTSLLIDEVISGRASMALPAGSVPGQGLLPEGTRAGSEDPVG
jgi:hypothetical protein